MKKIIGSILTSAFLLLSGVLQWSCTPKPIDVKLDPHEPRLVIASQIIPGSILLVALTKSFSSLDIDADEEEVTEDFLERILVDSALVTVAYRNVVDTLFKVSAGIYASLNTLQFDNEIYTLYAKDYETGLEATATTTMLPFVPFDTIYPVLIKNPGDTTVIIEYGFTDPPEKNWYVVEYVRQLSDSESVGIDIKTYFGPGANLVVETDLITDQTFENSEYRVQRELPNVSASDSIVVALTNITEGYFKFLNARVRSGSIVAVITQEPINFPTNVVGGYGYFTAHFPDIRYFNLKDY